MKNRFLVLAFSTLLISVLAWNYIQDNEITPGLKSIEETEIKSNNNVNQSKTVTATQQNPEVVNRLAFLENLDGKISYKGINFKLTAFFKQELSEEEIKILWSLFEDIYNPETGLRESEWFALQNSALNILVNQDTPFLENIAAI